jgi:hypothetical protein
MREGLDESAKNCGKGGSTVSPSPLKLRRIPYLDCSFALVGKGIVDLFL